MDILTPALIGMGISMDCFAVSLVIGTTTKTRLIYAATIIALCFGVFQAGMTAIGWLAGISLIGFISAYDHWISFLLLAIVGGKMIWEGVQGSDDETHIEVIRIVPLIVLSLATSIDSLAVGALMAVLVGTPAWRDRASRLCGRLVLPASGLIVITLLIPFSPSFPQTRPWWFSIWTVRVLLISPNTEMLPDQVSLGLAYVSAVLEANQHEHRVLDLSFVDDYAQALEQAVAEFAPEAIGISLRNVDNVAYPNSCSYLPFYRQIMTHLWKLSTAPIVLGGSGFSLMPRLLLDYLQADYGV